MDLISHSLDLLFLLFAIAFIPNSPFSSSSNSTSDSNANPSPSIQVDTTLNSEHSTPAPSPSPHVLTHSSPSLLAVPVPAVPSITLTPDQSKSFPKPFFGRRASHSRRPGLAEGRKSVSFSLSSMDDFLPRPSDNDEDGHDNDKGGLGKRRPPTPFVRGPKSPIELATTPLTSQPPTPIPAILSHAPHAEDPMGVKKQWLMA